MLPLKVKPPVAVEPEPKHGLAVVKFRLEMLRLFPPLAASVRVKAKTGELLVLLRVSAAVQFPLMVLLEPDPQPASSRAIPSKRTLQIGFIDSARLQDAGLVRNAITEARIGLFPNGRRETHFRSEPRFPARVVLMAKLSFLSLYFLLPTA